MNDLRQLDLAIGNTFPVILSLISDGTLFFQPLVGITTVYDISEREDGVHGVFTIDGFSLWRDKQENKLDYMYHVPYNYKDMPLLKDWLIQQNLVIEEGI